MREFVLHDGEDDAVTEKLHEFLDGLEWDGDNSGISIWLSVNVGDTIIIEDNGAIRIVKKQRAENP